MKSASELLRAYDAAVDQTPASPPLDHIDEASKLILILAIYDFRSGEWVHDFLVKQGHLPQATGVQLASQTRKVQRWRAETEIELGLPARPPGAVPPAYKAMRKKWEAANPRPTAEQLQEGWTPVRVDFSEFLSMSPVTKTASLGARKPERSEVYHKGGDIISSESTEDRQHPRAKSERTPEEVIASLPRDADGSIKIQSPKPTAANLDQYRL